ncbi:MAG TPA: hypothetical protein VFR85_13560 [Anaeromyxobacteraceae bacterium]|nr:hypothetical protein [Anaeromyxobacteraceae bacterium]
MVVLDLATLAFYRLGGAAVGIAQALARGEAPGAIADRLARDAGIDPLRARSDVDGVAAALAADARAAPEEGPLSTQADPRFASTGLGLELIWGSRAVLRLDRAGGRAWLVDGPLSAPAPAERLRWALPHLVWLAGGTVLHASAVQRAGAVLAITGATGSGKSTLARLLADGDPVSDDLLFLRPGPRGPEVALGGEAAARAWEAREVARLTTREEVRLAPGELAAMSAGPALPLGAVWVLDAARRDGEAIALSPVAGADGLGLLLEQSFGETGFPEVWRRIFEASADIAAAVPLYRATVPAALPALGEAARRYRHNVAS